MKFDQILSLTIYSLYFLFLSLSRTYKENYHRSVICWCSVDILFHIYITSFPLGVCFPCISHLLLLFLLLRLNKKESIWLISF